MFPSQYTSNRNNKLEKMDKLQEEAELPDFTFFYRDMDKSEGVIGKV